MLLGTGDKLLADCAKPVNQLLPLCGALHRLSAQGSQYVVALANLALESCSACEKGLPQADRQAREGLYGSLRRVNQTVQGCHRVTQSLAFSLFTNARNGSLIGPMAAGCDRPLTGSPIAIVWLDLTVICY